VLIDIGMLESIRVFAGYRMIIFGGLVAVLLIVRPRGLLDERLVHRIGRVCSACSAARGRTRMARKGSPHDGDQTGMRVGGSDRPAGGRVRANARQGRRDLPPSGTTLQYDCSIMLTNARTSEPLGGVTLTVGADMPSMPMMHNVRPVAATPGAQAGTYQARLTLEMHGDWALQHSICPASVARTTALPRSTTERSPAQALVDSRTDFTRSGVSR
jgi:hypothetical protein